MGKNKKIHAPLTENLVNPADRSALDEALGQSSSWLSVVNELIPEAPGDGKSSVESSARRANARRAGGASHYPRASHANWRGLAPGLTILYGGRATGKTVNALSLQLEALRDGVYAEYHAVMEPRGLIFSQAVSSVAAQAADAASSASRTKEQEQKQAALNAAQAAHIIPTSYSSWLHQRLQEASSRAVGSEPPVVVIDSLTYTIRHLDETKAALLGSGGKDVTYSGGLSAMDILGALHHTLLAEAYGVVLVGVVNSELLPIAEVLTGAVEGILASRGVGQLVGPSRESARRYAATTINPETVRIALWMLGYAKRPEVGVKASREKARAAQAREILSTDIV